jgi:hypothetical protein
MHCIIVPSQISQICLQAEIPNTPLWCGLWRGFSALANVSTDYFNGLGLYVSLVTRGTLQIQIRFVRQQSDPTLETDKQMLIGKIARLLVRTNSMLEKLWPQCVG